MHTCWSHTTIDGLHICDPIITTSRAVLIAIVFVIGAVVGCESNNIDQSMHLIVVWFNPTISSSSITTIDGRCLVAYQHRQLLQRFTTSPRTQCNDMGSRCSARTAYYWCDQCKMRRQLRVDTKLMDCEWPDLKFWQLHTIGTSTKQYANPSD